jgi:hypothetical protein
MKGAIAWRAYLDTHEGTRLVIEQEKSEVSDAMRGYMFGAVIPFLKRIVPDWQSLTNDQVHEILKKNFNYFEAFNPVTKRVERYGQSIMSKSTDNQAAMEFIQEIEGWVLENYAQHLPDPAKFKAWRDSAPLQGETFTDV